VTLIPLVALGFVLGLRHATDTDHVVAVTALVSRERSFRSALALGGFWGLGHMLTLLAVGGAVVACGLVIPPHVGLWLEMAVAVMLVLVGAANLGALAARAAEPGHASADLGALTRKGGLVAWLRRGSRSLAVGAVHGLAGSAAVALLVLTAERRVLPALGYLVLFGVGTIAGMLLVTASFALPLRAASSRFASLERGVARATGVLSVAVGLFLAYRIGFVDGLLFGHAGPLSD
jgi:high-affinity nickel-transport protein